MSICCGEDSLSGGDSLLWSSLYVLGRPLGPRFHKLGSGQFFSDMAALNCPYFHQYPLVLILSLKHQIELGGIVAVVHWQSPIEAK